jgi:putative spermidine/putrescine transport system permease protein
MAQLAVSRPADFRRTGASARGRAARRGRGLLMTILLLIALVYMILPLIATLGFSLATIWSRTVLPEGYTLHWYREAIADERFQPTVTRSLKVVLASSILSPLLVTPALLYVHLKAPKYKPWLEFLSIVPWALPGVVLALAMIRAYISPYNVNRPLLLVLTYVLLSLPFMFRAIDAGLSSISARTLVDAAQVLGAGWFDVTRRVLIPNIISGILSGALLVAALAAGEYALASLMVGSGWKTFPIYQAQTQNIDGRIASALAVLGILFTFVISMALIFLSTRGRRGRNATVTPMANK